MDVEGNSEAVDLILDLSKETKEFFCRFESYLLWWVAEEYLYSGNYCFIEWPEVIEDLLPDNTVNLLFTELPDGTRRLVVE